MISNHFMKTDFDFGHWFYWFFLFFEILKITHHVHGDQCNWCSNLAISNFVISPAFITWVYSVLPPNKREEVFCIRGCRRQRQQTYSSSVQTSCCREWKTNKLITGTEFFGGDGSNSPTSSGSQAMSYLADSDKSLVTVHLYPSVKLVFMQYNTVLGLL